MGKGACCTSVNAFDSGELELRDGVAFKSGQLYAGVRLSRPRQSKKGLTKIENNDSGRKGEKQLFVSFKAYFQSLTKWKIYQNTHGTNAYGLKNALCKLLVEATLILRQLYASLLTQFRHPWIGFLGRSAEHLEHSGTQRTQRVMR